MFHGTLKLNSARVPKELDLTEPDERMLPAANGRVMAAIDKIAGETRVVAAPPKPGEPRPADFKPTPRALDRTGGVAVVHLKKK